MQEDPTEDNTAATVWGFAPFKTVLSHLITAESPVLGCCTCPSRLCGWSGVVTAGKKEGKESKSWETSRKAN